MFQDLPSRIDKRLDPEMMARRRRRFHPAMLDELWHFSEKSEDPHLSFLMMISFLKEDFPWLYEIGLDTYRILKATKSKTERVKALRNFERAYEMFQSPMMMEFYGRSEDTYVHYRELRHFMHRFLNRVLKRDVIEKE